MSSAIREKEGKGDPIPGGTQKKNPIPKQPFGSKQSCSRAQRQSRIEKNQKTLLAKSPGDGEAHFRYQRKAEEDAIEGIAAATRLQ